MYQLDHIRDQRRLISLLSSLEESDVGVQILLFIGNGDYTDLLVEGTISVAEDKPTIVAELTLATRIRRDLENAPIAIKADIDGIIIPLLSGTISQPDAQEDFSTKLTVASAGGLLDKVRVVPSNAVRHITEYASWEPERVIRDAVNRCAGVGGYNSGSVYIQRIGVPLISYTGQDGFEDGAKCWDILQKVSEQAQVLYRDSPDGGFESFKDPATGESSPTEWNYETTTTEVLKWVPPTLASPDEQYTDVLVRKKEDDGAYSSIGCARVDFFRTPYPPHKDQTLVVDYPDKDPPDASKARRMAFDQARILSQGVYKAEVAVSFHPLFQKGDALHFLEDYVDEKGRWRRHWRAVIKSFKHVFKEGIETDLTCEFYILKEELLAGPSTLGKKAGRLSVGVAIPNLGPLFPRRGLHPGPGLHPR